MYAITSTSYRSIVSPSEAVAGETVVDVVPDSLLNALLATQLRFKRDGLLTSCDWTQSGDSPLDASTKAAWASYRQALRNLPAQAGFPSSVTWPTPP